MRRSTTLASESGFVRTRSAAWGAHHLLDELSEGAGFSGRCPSGREHSPEIDPGQFPILQHHLNRSICDLRREHPLRSDRDASIGKYNRAHSLRSTDAQPTFQCDRNFRIITLKGPVPASCFLVVNHSLVRGEVAGCRRPACPLEIGRGTEHHMPPAGDTPRGQAGVRELPHAEGDIDPLLNEVDVPIVQNDFHFKSGWRARNSGKRGIR
jgi:hypothetical protein